MRDISLPGIILLMTMTLRLLDLGATFMPTEEMTILRWGRVYTGTGNDAIVGAAGSVTMDHTGHHGDLDFTGGEGDDLGVLLGCLRQSVIMVLLRGWRVGYYNGVDRCHNSKGD
ncbi:hypothetical protein [Photorhabdus africana]|uniref:hypothetical protein n=1 Tax=Photorhabdus africana TaxID=3097554 RepID=UPI002B404539|nr:hypothetical protein [Photorhabdus sp. CRI-LC]